MLDPSRVGKFGHAAGGPRHGHGSGVSAGRELQIAGRDDIPFALAPDCFHATGVIQRIAHHRAFFHPCLLVHPIGFRLPATKLAVNPDATLGILPERTSHTGGNLPQVGSVPRDSEDHLLGPVGENDLLSVRRDERSEVAAEFVENRTDTATIARVETHEKKTFSAAVFLAFILLARVPHPHHAGVGAGQILDFLAGCRGAAGHGLQSKNCADSEHRAADKMKGKAIHQRVP